MQNLRLTFELDVILAELDYKMMLILMKKMFSTASKCKRIGCT